MSYALNLYSAAVYGNREGTGTNWALYRMDVTGHVDTDEVVLSGNIPGYRDADDDWHYATGKDNLSLEHSDLGDLSPLVMLSILETLIAKILETPRWHAADIGDVKDVVDSAGLWIEFELPEKHIVSMSVVEALDLTNDLLKAVGQGRRRLWAMEGKR